VVGSTITANVDFDVRDPAVPAVIAATTSRNASATAKRLIFSPLAGIAEPAYSLVTAATSA
jgi:hypothetical protein